MTLREVKKKWEAGLVPLFQLAGGATALSVVLTGDNGGYYVLHYTHAGLDLDDDRWDVVADVHDGTGNEVVDALHNRHPLPQ